MPIVYKEYDGETGQGENGRFVKLTFESILTSIPTSTTRLIHCDHMCSIIYNTIQPLNWYMVQIFTFISNSLAIMCRNWKGTLC